MTYETQHSKNQTLEAYLDNAATTKPRPEVAKTMQHVLEIEYGNASSLHSLGKRSKKILEQSREILAEALGVFPDEIYFTSGGTEANNLAIYGVCRARGKKHGQIITSTLEHPSVTRSVRGLKREGWKVSYVNAVAGNFDIEEYSSFLQEKTTLVSVMTVQNELGYRMPIADICRIRDQYSSDALVHTDAVQAFGKVSLPLRDWGVDLASLSAHKIGGPKGIGALFVRRGTAMFTTAFGGGQERGLRSGTEAVFLIAGFAQAVKLAYENLALEERRVLSLWDHLAQRISMELPNAIINSRRDGSPYIFNVSVLGMNNQKALEYLSEKNIFVSKAAACESNHTTVEPGTWRPKHPLSLQAAGIPLSLGKSTLRISFAYNTDIEAVDYFVDELKKYCALNNC